MILTRLACWGRAGFPCPGAAYRAEPDPRPWTFTIWLQDSKRSGGP